MRKSVSQFDPRLIGTWKSDRRRTFRHFKPSSNCSPRSLNKFKAIFGKMVIRWGREKFYSEFDGFRDTARYETVASDSDSVVVRVPDVLSGEDVLRQIHFAEDYYWIAVSGNMHEWFKRVG